MKAQEFIKENITTLASRTIRNYAREIGPDSMDYGMFIKSAELLDKGMLKSLAQLIDKSDTAPREYVMKKIADHDPETFKKMYGDQEGYLSVMKPAQDLKDAEDNTDRGGKEGFEYPEGGKYGYKAERGSGTGAMGTMQVNVTLHNRETDEIMYIKDMHYLELNKGEEQETLAMIWDENKDLITKESAPDPDAEKADAARGMWASSKELQAQYKTWQDFLNSEEFDDYLDDEFRNQLEGLTFEDIKPYVSMYKGNDGKIVHDVLDKDEKSVYKTNNAKDAMNYLSKNFNKLRGDKVKESIKESRTKIVEAIKAKAEGNAQNIAGVEEEIERITQLANYH